MQLLFYINSVLARMLSVLTPNTTPRRPMSDVGTQCDDLNVVERYVQTDPDMEQGKFLLHVND